MKPLMLINLAATSISKNTEPLDLINTGFSLNEIFKPYFQSLSNILLTLGICGTVVTLSVYALICMIKSGNSENLRNFKDNVAIKIGLLIFLFNISTFAGIAKKIAESFI